MSTATPDPSSPKLSASEGHSASAAGLVQAILSFLADQDLLPLDDVAAVLEAEVSSAGSAALLALKARLAEQDEWIYHPPDRLARRIHHLLADRFVSSQSRVDGIDHLQQAMSGPVVICANHLSYSDANLIEILLHRCGAQTLAERLTAIAGPKVYSSRERRFSSLCFGTIKTPQSAEVSSAEATLKVREVAKAAQRSIVQAHLRLAAGDALVLFGEGTRSRSGGMQRMLAGVARYLSVPGTRVLPVGLAGTEVLFPIENSSLQPAKVLMHVGPPLDAERLMANAQGDRRTVMDAIGLAIAELLPNSYRGVYGVVAEYGGAAEVLGLSRGA